MFVYAGMSEEVTKTSATFFTQERDDERPFTRGQVQERVVVDPSAHTHGMKSVLVQEWEKRSALWRDKHLPPVEPEVVTLRATDTYCPSRRVDTGQGPIQDMAPSFLKQHPNLLKHQALTHSKRINKTIELLGMCISIKPHLHCFVKTTTDQIYPDMLARNFGRLLSAQETPYYYRRA